MHLQLLFYLYSLVLHAQIEALHTSSNSPSTSQLSIRSEDTHEAPFIIYIYTPLVDGFGKVVTNVSWGFPYQTDVRTTLDTTSSQFWVNTNSSSIKSLNAQTGKICEYRVMDYVSSVHNLSSVYNYEESIMHTTPVPDKVGFATYRGSRTVHFPTSTTELMTWFGPKFKFFLTHQEVSLVTNTWNTFSGASCLDAIPDNTIDASILGMGPNSKWRNNLFAKGRIPSMDWSMWFTKPSSRMPIPAFYGSAIIGAGPLKSAFKGKLVNVSLINTDPLSKEFYTITTPMLYIGDTHIPLVANGSKTLILDSGSAKDVVPYSPEHIIEAADGKLLSRQGPDGLNYFAFNGTCESMSSKLTLDYTFHGNTKSEMVTIEVPLRHYALGPVAETGPGAQLCDLGKFASGSTGPAALGPSFLSAATLWFQHDAQQIGIAQGSLKAISMNGK